MWRVIISFLISVIAVQQSIFFSWIVNDIHLMLLKDNWWSCLLGCNEHVQQLIFLSSFFSYLTKTTLLILIISAHFSQQHAYDLVIEEMLVWILIKVEDFKWERLLHFNFIIFLEMICFSIEFWDGMWPVFWVRGHTLLRIQSKVSRKVTPTSCGISLGCGAGRGGNPVHKRKWTAQWTNFSPPLSMMCVPTYY